MTTLSDWLHALPASHVQALRDFRRCARAAYPDKADYLARAFDAGDLTNLMAPSSDPRKALSHSEAAAIVSAMPRAFVITLHG